MQTDELCSSRNKIIEALRDMTLIVQKFGGTSVSTPERRQQVIEKILTEKRKGNDVVAVVSAMGRRGDPYATDTFLDMLQKVTPSPIKEPRIFWPPAARSSQPVSWRNP